MSDDTVKVIIEALSEHQDTLHLTPSEMADTALDIANALDRKQAENLPATTESRQKEWIDNMSFVIAVALMGALCGLVAISLWKLIGWLYAL